MTTPTPTPSSAPGGGAVLPLPEPSTSTIPPLASPGRKSSSETVVHRDAGAEDESGEGAWGEAGGERVKSQKGGAVSADGRSQPEKGKDVEKEVEKLDIEHIPVPDDPRKWSNTKKNVVLFIIAFAAMASALAANIYFPAIDSLQSDLSASDTWITQTVAVFILVQGSVPVLWSAFSEIKGRKIVYLASMSLFTLASAISSRANSVGLFFGMRILQAFGSSAVLAIGAGTLADIFDPHERGTKVGIYYIAPLLGPSLGPLIGGAVTSASSWRSTFYFLIAYGGVCVLTFVVFPDTFRKERSLAWRAAMRRAQMHAAHHSSSSSSSKPSSRRPSRRPSLDHTTASEKPPSTATDPLPQTTKGTPPVELAEPKGPTEAPATAAVKAMEEGKIVTTEGAEAKIRITLRDVNPLSAVFLVLRQPNNLLSIGFSGLLFGLQYSLSYTAARSFAAPPYNYDALKVGLVLLSFGVGNIVGSLGGGRYSDWIFSKLKEKNGGVGVPEMRIKSVTVAMFILPPSLIAYAWVVDKTVPIYWPIIVLFIAGLAAIWIYSSTLAYVIDANPGRSSSAVACNSMFRGTFGMIATEIAQPLEDSVGNGALYTGWAIVIALAELSLVVVLWKGAKWREDWVRKEDEESRRKEEKARLDGGR